MMSMKTARIFFTKKSDKTIVSKSFHFGVLVPDFDMVTSLAKVKF